MKHSEAFEKLVADTKTHISEIDLQTFIKKRDAKEALSLIDVREDNEFDRGYIAGATHLGKGIIERDIEKYFPDRSACLILYCGGGYRSALACDSLQHMGYKNVHSLAGGFKAWCDKNLPICQSKG